MHHTNTHTHTNTHKDSRHDSTVHYITLHYIHTYRQPYRHTHTYIYIHNATNHTVQPNTTQHNATQYITHIHAFIHTHHTILYHTIDSYMHTCTHTHTYTCTHTHTERERFVDVEKEATSPGPAPETGLGENEVDPTTGLGVFTAGALKSGACCGLECRHCPHGFGPGEGGERWGGGLEVGGSLFWVGWGQPIYIHPSLPSPPLSSPLPSPPIPSHPIPSIHRLFVSPSLCLSLPVSVCRPVCLHVWSVCLSACLPACDRETERPNRDRRAAGRQHDAGKCVKHQFMNIMSTALQSQPLLQAASSLRRRRQPWQRIGEACGMQSSGCLVYGLGAYGGKTSSKCKNFLAG